MKLNNFHLDCILQDFDIKSIDTEVIFLILPILGDNRIPDNVESWLINAELINTKKLFLVIAGDFSKNLEEGEMVLNEIIKLLHEKQDIKLSFNPFMLDTPVYLNSSIPINTWIEKVIQILQNGIVPFNFTISQSKLEEQRLKQNLVTKSISNNIISKSSEWINLCQILPAPPIISIEQNCIKLEFITKDSYARSLLRDLSKDKLKEIWKIINNIPGITAINIAFARIREWPGDLNHKLVSLDIRDNSFESFEFLDKLSCLVHLNISANSLTSIPPPVFRLYKLKELFCYKNQIEFIDKDIILLKDLERLSLYRNKLESFPNSLLSCLSLNYINIGANRITELPQEIIKLKLLDTLILRNSPISKLPSFLNLKTLELDKTPIKNLNYVT